MANPFGFGAEFGAAEIGDAELGQLSATATVFTITPGTGAVAIQGQPAPVRPTSVSAGSVTATGQQAVLNFGIIPGTGSVAVTGQAAQNATLSSIVSVEYVGDGNNPRTFTSFGTVPLVVFVFGKDGSGNLVGAIKTGDMPSGKSQPMEIAQASGASTRSNRILDLLPNGFTVGSDLNVTGRNYAYIIFPAGRATTVQTRTFVAPGGKPAVNSTLSTSGSSISGTSVFTSTGDEASGWARPTGSTVYSTGVALITAGRRLIRNSDGAVIAEVTTSIDANSATGVVYIAGSFAGGTWHWEEYYVDLTGQICDMILLMADDTGGTSPSVPLTVIKPTEMAGTNGDWNGNGFGELDVFLASDTDKALHINPRVSGGAPALTKGTTYHVVTFHDDETNTGVKLHTFTWTGTGPLGTPPTLSGMDFAPSWAFVYNSNNSFTWSKNSPNILGANLHDRGWIDTGGDSSQPALVSWDSGGVTLTANGDWNSNGAKYLGIFFVAEPALSVPPSTGTLTIDGQQPIQILGVIPSTGVLSLVGQTPVVTITANVDITPSTGSLTLDGQQAILELGLPQGSGSLDLTGYSPTILIDFIITPDAGSVTITGYQPGVEVHTDITPDTGAVTVVGYDPILELGLPQGTGTLDLTGYAPTILIDFIITPDAGSVVVDGGAVTLEGGIPIGTAGALVLTGTQPILNFGIIPDTGSLTVDGQAAIVNSEGFITIGTGSVDVVGYQPILDLGIIPSTGALTLTGYTPLFAPPVEITPGTGAVNIVGNQPIVKNIITDILLVEWNDRAKLNAILPLQWTVFSGALTATLPVTWNDIETINPLLVTWRVIPDLEPLFNEDVQQPTATVEEFD